MERSKDVDVWPENWPSVTLFVEVGNQWNRSGMSGVEVSLNYAVLFARMERMRLSDERWEEMFSDIRHMEREALRVMRESR